MAEPPRTEPPRTPLPRLLGSGFAYGLGTAVTIPLAVLLVVALGQRFRGVRLDGGEALLLAIGCGLTSIPLGVILLVNVELARRAPPRWRLAALAGAGAAVALLLSAGSAWTWEVYRSRFDLVDAVHAFDADIVDWWRQHPGEGGLDVLIGLTLYTACAAGILPWPLPSLRRRLLLALLGGLAAWGLLALGDVLFGWLMFLPTELWRQPLALPLVALAAALGLELGRPIDRALAARWAEWRDAD